MRFCWLLHDLSHIYCKRTCELNGFGSSHKALFSSKSCKQYAISGSNNMRLIAVTILSTKFFVTVDADPGAIFRFASYTFVTAADVMSEDV